MALFQANCLIHDNGGCAAFVAIASRLGLHDWAWQFMLSHYDRSATWDLPKYCDLEVGDAACPIGHEVAPTDFPDALAHFLAVSAYKNAMHLGANPDQPSFDCAQVKSDNLKLVCATPALAAADRTLAAAYIAAMADQKKATQIKSDERAFIVARNNAADTVEALQALYDQRIDELAAASISSNQ